MFKNKCKTGGVANVTPPVFKINYILSTVSIPKR